MRRKGDGVGVRGKRGEVRKDGPLCNRIYSISVKSTLIKVVLNHE